MTTYTSVINAHLHDESSATWQPLLMLAGLYDQNEEPAKAYERAQRAARFAPEHPEILVALSYLSGKLHLPREEQLGWPRRLLAGSRDDGFKEQARALLLQVAADEDDASLVLEALAGQAKGVSDQQAILMRAAAYGSLGQDERQFEELDGAVRRYPAEAKIRLALADLQKQRGQVPEALAMLAGGLDQPEPPADLYQQLGLLLAQQGRPADAANALEIAARLSAGDRPLVPA